MGKMRIKQLLFVMVLWVGFAEAGVYKSFPLNMIGIVTGLKLIPDARILYSGLPNPALFEEIYRNAPQAKIDFFPDGSEYDNVLLYIAPENRPVLSWVSHLKQGGRGGIVAFPLFLEGPFPFPNYLGMLKEMRMDIIQSTTRHLGCCPVEPTYTFRKWIEDSIIIPFGMPPSEELIDQCITLISTNKMIRWINPLGPYVFINEVQIILFERL